MPRPTGPRIDQGSVSAFGHSPDHRDFEGGQYTNPTTPQTQTQTQTHADVDSCLGNKCANYSSRDYDYNHDDNSQYPVVDAERDQEDYYSCHGSDSEQDGDRDHDHDHDEGYTHYHDLRDTYESSRCTPEPDYSFQARPSRFQSNHGRRPQSLHSFTPRIQDNEHQTRRPASVLSARSLPASAAHHRDRAQWHVRASGPTTGVEDTPSRARLDRTSEARAELTSLYSPGMPNSASNKRSSWGGSLINGAVSAAVFSAAVGLTAYRLWRGWDDDQDDGPHADDDGDAYMRKDPLSEIYEPEGGIEEAEPVREHYKNQYQYPYQLAPPRRPPSEGSSVRSPPSTRRRSRKKRAQRPSIAELVVATARAQGHHHRGPGSPVASSATSMSVATGPVSDLSKSPLLDNRTLPDEIQEEEGESDDEMNSRLDDMARRLQELISEGERALAAKAAPSEASSTPFVDKVEWLNLRLHDHGDEPPSDFDRGDEPSSVYDSRAEPTSASTFATAPDWLSRMYSSRPALTPARSQEVSRRSSISSIPRPRSIRGTPGTPSPLPFPASPSVGASPDTSLSSVPESSPRDRRSSSGSWTRGLPPLPWRRDPSGEPRWVQRPLSPSAPERSLTPVPPVPPIPPEHAVASRPSSMIYLQKRNSTKRNSTPALKLTPRRSKPPSPAPIDLGSPGRAPRPELLPSPGPQSPLPRSPMSPTSPLTTLSRSSSIISSRIPRHIRTSSIASGGTSAPSPPPSPTPMRSRASTLSRSPSTALSNLPTLGDTGNLSGRLSALSGTSGASGSRAHSPATSTTSTPSRRHQSLDWRDTPTSSSRLRFARPPIPEVARTATGIMNGSNSSPAGSRKLLASPVTPTGIVAARTAVYSASSSPDRQGRHTPPPHRWQARPQSPGSAGSGRSRIPVRRSIDPDAFADFGRIE